VQAMAPPYIPQGSAAPTVQCSVGCMRRRERASESCCQRSRSSRKPLPACCQKWAPQLAPGPPLRGCPSDPSRTRHRARTKGTQWGPRSATPLIDTELAGRDGPRRTLGPKSKGLQQQKREAVEGGQEERASGALPALPGVSWVGHGLFSGLAGAASGAGVAGLLLRGSAVCSRCMPWWQTGTPGAAEADSAERWGGRDRGLACGCASDVLVGLLANAAVRPPLYKTGRELPDSFDGPAGLVMLVDKPQARGPRRPAPRGCASAVTRQEVVACRDAGPHGRGAPRGVPRESH